MKKRIVVAVVLAVLVALALLGCVSTKTQTTQTTQTTSLFEAAKTGTAQDVQAAIDEGADIKARDNNGVTALMYAAGHNPNPR